MKAVTADQMRLIDKASSDRYGIPTLQLMENAGHAVAQSISHDLSSCRVTIVAGKGNNAGDGFVAARYLSELDFKVTVVMLTPPEVLPPDSRKNYEQLLGSMVVMAELKSGTEDSIADYLKDAAVIVDAIFGFGFHGCAEGVYEAAIKAMNRSDRPIYSIDIPSGLHADTGEVVGEAIYAATTLALGLPKVGFNLGKGPLHVGILKILPIGHPDELLKPYLN